MSSLILRLRHLQAVYGRNFDTFNDEFESAVGVTFALSSVNQDNIGYYYVSEVATNIENPEWESIEVHSLPKQFSSSKAVLFTFFLVHKESNSLLFEILVHFSGLVLANSESKDQVYFQMGSHIYSPREYFSPNIISTQMWPKSTSRHVLKPSYNLSSLQKFLVNKEALKVQLKRIKYMQGLANVLKSSLHSLISQGVAAEKMAVAIGLVKKRIELTRCLMLLTGNKIEALKSKRFSLEQELLNLSESRTVISNRLEVLHQSLKVGYKELNKIQCALFVRILHLLNEVYSLFVSDLLNPVFNANHQEALGMHESNLSDDNSSTLLDGSDLSAMMNSHPVHHPSIDYGADFFTSPICFAYITHLFALIAAILDQPIIYPRDFVENYPKLKLMDIFTRDLSQSDRCLAACILNRNIFSLGSRFNLCLTPEKHALFNLKSLFDHFQNNLLAKIYQYEISGFV
uniref:Uncharacterized protein n=1 Tax=Trichobilharzia regenti TaxID=157069 RepID=A0AA85J3H1_TRIRE|nr:unnamed protein product [Trichobilharzia regenti]